MELQENLANRICKFKILRPAIWSTEVLGEMGSQHPSPNVKNPLRIRAANWLEIITSRDAKSACFQGSKMLCTEIISCFFARILPKKITSRDGCVLLMKRHKQNPTRRSGIMLGQFQNQLEGCADSSKDLFHGLPLKPRLAMLQLRLAPRASKKGKGYKAPSLLEPWVFFYFP